MKRIKLTFALLLGFIGAFAQTTPKLDTTKRIVPKSVQTFDINQFLPQITPKSPNVAALERFGEIPVNLNNGLAEIPIPIFEIKIGSLKVPIRLLYHHAGNKVSDNASWVGQGWSLQAGGSTSRNIRGRADEDAGNGGVLGQNLFNLDSYLTNISCLTEQLKIDLDLFAQFGKDIERDIFTVSIPSKNNSFALLPTGAFWLESDKSKIEYTAGLQSIKLTDENGFRYNFADKETTGGYTSAWHLTEIQGNKPTEKIIFNYQDNDNIPVFTAELSDYEVFNTDISGLHSGDIAGGRVAQTNTNNTPIIFTRLLNEIYFPNGKIVFNTASNRQDNLGKSLSNIEIYGFNVNTNTYTLIKKFILNQSYKDGRLFLDSVDLVNTSGGVIGSYICNYNTTPLPEKLSRSKDFWGFYNGQSNTTLIPTQTFQANERTNIVGLTTYNVGGANRNPDEFYMQARILTKLTYPTGGFSDFEYEAHRHDGGILAGGLRIKKTISNDGAGKTITRTYKYGENQDGNGTYRNITPFTYSTIQYQKHPADGNYTPMVDAGREYYYNVRVFSSAFITSQNPSEGSPVTYPFVTEYQDDGSGSNGKTFYVFDEGNGDDLVVLPSTAKNFYRSKHWSRGQLLSKTVYGANGSKKSKMVNTFATIINGNSPVLGYLVGRSEVQLNFYTTDTQGCLQDYSLFTPIRNTFWSYGLRKQIRSEEYNYNDTDDTKFVYKKSETDFDNVFFQAKEVRSFKSDGKINIQKFRYVTDFDLDNPNLFNAGSSLYLMRENNQINTPIEQNSLVKFSTELENRFLGGQITDFQTSTYGGYSYIYPKEVFSFENALFPSIVLESNYSTTYLSVGILWKDYRYVKRLQSDSYDTYGNLLSYKMVGGSFTSFSYSTTELDNVFHNFPTSETKNSGGVTSYTTSFSYDIPLLGVKEITAPNGLKAYFDYDNFSRFKRAKDHNGNILKEHDYNFGLGNNFIKEFIPRIEMSSLSGTYEDFQTNISYSDGLNRHLQTVNLLAGFGGANDIVTDAKVYENLGRIEKSFIPFSNVGSGAVAPLPTTVHGDTAPYNNVSEYDNSPLNRPKKMFGVGQAWRTVDKFIEAKYLIVDVNTIRKYALNSLGASVDGTWDVILFKNVSISEREKQTIEYKDNDGKLIQKDVQDGANSYASTHYIYDEFDRLKYVIQPESFKTSQNFTENDAYFKAGVFAYKYDKRGRVIENHVPSKGWTYHVFDILDREVLSQSEKQRQNNLNRWKFAQYDAISRVILKGQLINTRDRPTLQTDFEGITNAFESWSIVNHEYSNVSFPSVVTFIDTDIKLKNFYDFYDWIAGEWAYNSVGAYHANYADAKGLLTGVLKRNLSNNAKVYFNTFHYDNKSRIIQTYETHHLGGIEPWKKAIITNFEYNFVGQIKTQNIIHQKDNAPNIEDKTEYQYDHVGRLLKVFHGINGNRFEVARFTYDAVGRMIQKKIRGDGNFKAGGTKDYKQRPSIDGIVTQNNTIDLARKSIILEPNLEIKALTLNSYRAEIDLLAPQGINISGLQTMDYTYHIRGMLSGINLDGDKNPTPDATQGDIFSYKLDYETANFYDGNIGKQSWKTSNDNALRYYSFDYDDINRLLSASYVGINGEDFSMPNFTYDKNGNIKNLQRKGKTGNTFDYMDNLTYTYNGNTLNSVTDAISGDHETDFVPRGGNAYTYYNDGSLMSDDNKEITNIIYDTYLDKPIEIQLTNSRWIKMIYDGSGKLINREFSTAETWDFVSNVTYKNSLLFQMITPEGRATYANNTWNYEYFYQDHLGNARVSFSAEGQNLVVKDISDFDPTGIQLKGIGIENTTENRFKYQNKESLALFGLSGINDFDARYADKTINRFWGVDALSDKMRSNSPFNISFNNPLRFIDPDGNEAKDDYKLHKNGDLTLLKKTDSDEKNGTHTIYNESEKQSIVVNKNVIDNSREGKNAVYKDNSDARFYPSEDVKEGFKIFKFFAKNSDVEFGFNIYKSNKDNSTTSVISTSLETSSEGAQAGFNYLILQNKSISIVESWHSHPNVTNIKNFLPSGFYSSGATYNSGDRKYFEQLKYGKMFNTNQTPANFNIYGTKINAHIIYNNLNFSVNANYK